jgi:drug/metabolite transporter (DMT)-like permease
MAQVSWLEMVVAIARAILHDRTTRRKWLGSSALLLLGVFALGLWGIDDWLNQSIARFGLWWLGVVGLTLVVMIFALYDALAAIREERDKMK